jgi:hypothetical protein
MLIFVLMYSVETVGACLQAMAFFQALIFGGISVAAVTAT